MTVQTQAAAASASAALPRRFGLLQATALNMSTMIGVGPFITIPVLMAAMGGPQAMLGWVVALVIACSDGLVWSELGAMMPGSGGSYLYLREAFGPEKLGRAVSFLFIWQFLLSGPLEIASGYIGFAQYASYLWPGLGANGSRLLMAGVGILIIFLLYRRITQIGRITICLWIGTLLTVGVVIVSGPFHFDPKLAFDFPPGAFSFSLGFVMGLGAAAIVCSFLPLMTVIDALLTTRILVQFIGQIGAVWWLRRRQPKAERPFKMWLYPLPALVALVGWLFLFGTTNLTELLYSLGVLAFGVVVFLGWSRWTRRWPFEARSCS